MLHLKARDFMIYHDLVNVADIYDASNKIKAKPTEHSRHFRRIKQDIFTDMSSNQWVIFETLMFLAHVYGIVSITWRHYLTGPWEIWMKFKKKTFAFYGRGIPLKNGPQVIIKGTHFNGRIYEHHQLLSRGFGSYFKTQISGLDSNPSMQKCPRVPRQVAVGVWAVDDRELPKAQLWCLVTQWSQPLNERSN